MYIIRLEFIIERIYILNGHLVDCIDQYSSMTMS